MCVHAHRCHCPHVEVRGSQFSPLFMWILDQRLSAILLTGSILLNTIISTQKLLSLMYHPLCCPASPDRTLRFYSMIAQRVLVQPGCMPPCWALHWGLSPRTWVELSQETDLGILRALCLWVCWLRHNLWRKLLPGDWSPMSSVPGNHESISQFPQFSLDEDGSLERWDKTVICEPLGSQSCSTALTRVHQRLPLHHGLCFRGRGGSDSGSFRPSEVSCCWLSDFRWWVWDVGVCVITLKSPDSVHVQAIQGLDQH